MSAEELKAATQRSMEEILNKGNVDAADEFYAPNFVRHRFPFPDIVGLEALKQFMTEVHSSYPDFHVTTHEIAVAGNTVTTRWTWQGAQSGQSPTTGAAPTGKQITVSGCIVAHWERGKVVEEWAYEDFLSMLQQLGVVPPLGQGE